MALPQMDPDPTSIDRLPGGPPVTTATRIHEAQAHLHLTGESAAVVYRDRRPVGVVTATALTRACNENRADAPITAVMDYVAVRVDQRADARDTVRIFNQAAWEWLTPNPE
jgi:CBS domain-containing protein